MLPVLAPQLVFAVEGVTEIVVGCVMVAEDVRVQPLMSVTVTVYVPTAKLVRGLVPVPVPVQE